jgi:hypothetical protein
MKQGRKKRKNQRTGRVARLQEEGVDEEMHEHGVTGGQGWVMARSSIPAVLSNQRCVNIVEHVGPYFTNI